MLLRVCQSKSPLALVRSPPGSLRFLCVSCVEIPLFCGHHHNASPPNSPVNMRHSPSPEHRFLYSLPGNCKTLSFVFNHLRTLLHLGGGGHGPLLPKWNPSADLPLHLFPHVSPVTSPSDACRSVRSGEGIKLQLSGGAT